MPALRWGSASDVGRFRTANEDSFWASDGVFAIADGMGGHAAGEVASALAISEVSQLADLSIRHPDDILELIGRANEKIVDAGSRRRDRFGMATTLTGICFVSEDESDQWAVFNVGDSRVYRFADGSLSQLTSDHSEVQEMVAAGKILPEQASSYPRRNVVTRWLGSETSPLADVFVFPWVPGERFLVCSDGLTNELQEGQIAEVLHDLTDPPAAAEELIRRANDAGGHDNTTVIVVDVAK
jgi:protein phosphatase